MLGKTQFIEKIFFTCMFSLKKSPPFPFPLPLSLFISATSATRASARSSSWSGTRTCTTTRTTSPPPPRRRPTSARSAASPSGTRATSSGTWRCTTRTQTCTWVVLFIRGVSRLFKKISETFYIILTNNVAELFLTFLKKNIRSPPQKKPAGDLQAFHKILETILYHFAK